MCWNVVSSYTLNIKRSWNHYRSKLLKFRKQFIENTMKIFKVLTNMFFGINLTIGIPWGGFEDIYYREIVTRAMSSTNGIRSCGILRLVFPSRDRANGSAMAKISGTSVLLSAYIGTISLRSFKIRCAVSWMVTASSFNMLFRRDTVARIAIGTVKVFGGSATAASRMAFTRSRFCKRLGNAGEQTRFTFDKHRRGINSFKTHKYSE